jgi:hypothetical protein
MTLVKYFKKLMGWCPMEDSLKNDRRCNSCFNFELKWSQQVPSPSNLQEGEILKAHAGLSRDGGIVKITLALLIILILMIYLSMISNFAFISHLPYLLIQYLALLALILYNHTTVMLTPDKLIIHRYFFKSLVLRKEDIVQTSVSRNKGNSFRWPMRLFLLALFAIQLPHTVESITRDLQMEAAPVFVILSSVMSDFWIVAFVFVIYYIFELTVPYQQILKITTRSNLNLEFYTEEPEKIMAAFKNKDEQINENKEKIVGLS